MKNHDLIPFSSTVLDARRPGASKMQWQGNLARRSGLPPLLLLCLGCFVLAFPADAAPMPVPKVQFESFPTDVLIGEDFKFVISFENIGNAAGYGPFFDLVLAAGGADFDAPWPACANPAPSPLCDGITFVKAKLVEVVGGPPALPAFVNTAPCNSGPAPHTFSTHPYQSSGVQPVTVLPGAQLVTIELPFGSFQPTQPKILVEVTAHVSINADPYDPLKPLTMLTNCLRGGFRFGTDEFNTTGDPPIFTDTVPPNMISPLFPPEQDSWKWQACKIARPTVFTMVKKYNGPEDETATGCNHPKTYTIFVDVATGQTINNLMVKDFLPDNMAYVGLVLGLTTPGFIIGTQPPPLMANLSPNNELKLTYPTVVGVTGPEIQVTFEFFIPDDDANNNPILSPTDCTPAMAINDICGSGMWTPADCRDLPAVTVSFSTLPTVDHKLFAKCLAVQKTVALVNDPKIDGPTPGDTLEYTINFEGSDYKTFGSIFVADLVSDGQTWLAGSATLMVSDVTGIVGPIPFPAGTINVQSICLGGPPPARTFLVFDVSQALVLDSIINGSPNANGTLTGGKANSSTTIPAVGKITFRTIIDDQFQCPVSPGNANVDKHDPLNNSVTIQADVLDNAPGNFPLGFQAMDDSAVAFTISAGTTTKTIEAINCLPPTGPMPFCVTACDTITFRITKTFLSGDTEPIMIEDFFPLPVLDVTGFTFSPTLCGACVPGQVCLGPLDDISSIAVPTFTVNASANSLVFNYPAIQNAANMTHTIDLLITAKVSTDPFADGLHLTNEAQEKEDNTFGATFPTTAIAEFKITEPNLKIFKGIVASDNPKTVFSQTALGPLVFTPPNNAACPRFAGGIINSTTLPSLAGLNSDVTCADAGDRLTFAIVVQNVGNGPQGAFDILIQETLPSCLISPANVCVTDGAGTILPWIGNLFGPGLELVDPNPPGALAPAHPTSGKDIAIITFDATYAPGPQPECCTNDVALVNYSNIEGGADFVAAGFGGPFTDTAEVCSQPKPVRKCIVTTSEGHTTLPEVAIGEIIHYQLQVQIPEGPTSPNFNVKDFLPPGLAYMPGSAKVGFVANFAVGNFLGALTTTLPGDETQPELVNCRTLPLISAFPANQITAPVFPVGGGPVVFNTLNFVNNDNDANCEFLVIEFNALVLNVAGNTACTMLPNQFGVCDGPTPIGPLSAPVSVTVYEPNIGVIKQIIVKPQKIGDPVTYTVTFVNQGPCPTTAFDVRLWDTLPGCLGNLTFVSASPPPTLNLSTPSMLDLTWAMVPVNVPVIVTYTAQQLCGDCSKLTNTANVTWTSLPGLNGTPTTPPISPSTPGASGAVNGERNGTTPPTSLNDYFASSSTNLCPDLAITKTAMGQFLAGLNGTYMLTVQNLGCGPAVAPVTVTDTLPPGLTPVSAAGNNWQCSISGNTVTCIYTGPAIPPGGSFPPITITVSISSTAGNSSILNCATVNSPNDNNPANNTDCVGVTVLTNRCLLISNEAITCSTNGGYTFSFDLVNLSAFPAYTVSFVAATPFGVTITPSPFVLSPPLNPGDPPRPVSVTINGPGCAKVCFLISIHDQFDVNCCTPDSAIPKCIVLPECDCVSAPAPAHLMVGWWRGDNTPFNSSSLANNGAWVGTAGYALGEVGQAFSVANASDYVSVADAPLLNFNASQSFTIDAWVRTVNPGIAPIVDKRSGTIFAASGYSFYLFGGTLGLQLNGVNYISPNPAINDGEWHHVAAVVDRPGGQARLYVNGTQVHSVGVSSVGSVANTGDFRIGQDRFGNNSFQGQLDEVELFRRVLTDQEIKSLWVAGCAGKCKCVAPPTGLVNWWRFDFKIGPWVFDSAGTVFNTGTTPGGSILPGKVSNALFLNGVNQWVTVANNVEVNFTGTCTGPGGAQSFTIDAWIKTDQLNETILDKRRAGPFGLFPRGYMLALVNGQLSVTLADGINHTYNATGPFLADNQWHFIAVTYDRCAGMLKLYVDANFTPVQMLTFPSGSLGSIANTSALYIGRRSPGFGSSFYRGHIDELEFYKRVLSDLEIYSIWNAGNAGKCRPGQPAIAQAPGNQWVNAGGAGNFTVAAVSDLGLLLSYQWLFNGTPIADATNDTFTVSNAQPTDAGVYSVTVTDDGGSVTSAPATLTVVGSGSYTITALPGFNLIANQLNHGNNLLSTVLPTVPEGTTLYKFGSGGFTVSSYLFGAWDNDLRLNPGEGGILENNSGEPFTITFTGEPVITPSLPLPLLPGLNLVSGQLLGPATFEDIVGYAPEEGTMVYPFDPSVGGNALDLEERGYTSSTFVDGAWDVEPKLLLPGEAVWIEVTPTAPAIVANPQGTNVVEGSTATFSVTASGSAPLQYQWQKNGADIPGATNRTLILTNVQLADDGSMYSVMVRNDTGSVASEAATLTVRPDLEPPTIVAASANCESNKVTVVFSEAVAAASAGDSFNYGLNGGVNITGATLLPDSKTVCLSTAPLQADTPYTLTVNNVTDLAGNVIAAGSHTFSCPTNDLPPFTLVVGVVPGGMLKFRWSGPAVLQAADNLTGSPNDWTDVSGASSGFMVNLNAAPKKFYRLKYQ